MDFYLPRIGFSPYTSCVYCCFCITFACTLRYIRLPAVDRYETASYKQHLHATRDYGMGGSLKGDDAHVEIGDMENAFVGDIVRLKTGGPRMVVSRQCFDETLLLVPGEFECTWFEMFADGTFSYCNEVFHMKTLVMVD